MILLFTESERIKVCNGHLIKKGVIHMANMSFFLNTCSVVKEEREGEREKYRLHNSIWLGLIVNCSQERDREGEK